MKRAPTKQRSRTDALDEHRAALAKIDATVAHMSDRAGDAITCQRGCDACCVDGLSVLPVEAALIEASGLRAPAHPKAGMCAFLDEDGACAIYPVRPVLCRTHGLALQSDAGERKGGLRVLGDDVNACELNYTTRAPKSDEILDATKVLMLLVTVDRRYRPRAKLADDAARVSLRELASRL